MSARTEVWYSAQVCLKVYTLYNDQFTYYASKRADGRVVMALRLGFCHLLMAVNDP